MKITFPHRSPGQDLTFDTDQYRQVIIIGANGSGKTRFANALARSVGDKAFRMSALKAAYDRSGEDLSANSIDSQYRAIATESGIIRRDINGELERIIAMMINEEMLKLLTEKYFSDEMTLRRHRSRLDRMIEIWSSLFPDNRILVAQGKLLIQGGDSDTYSSSKLSAGESAVMYYIGAALFAPQKGVVFVDSPETFLHPSMMRQVWDRIEKLRPDCTFIYMTHDLSFASTRSDALTVWVKSCDAEQNTWDYDTLTPADGMSEEVYMAILGARKPVLFIEGDGVNSIDSKLYPLIFDKYTVKAVGGCDRVIEATRTFNSLRDFHNMEAAGIVDRDRRDDGEVRYLREKRIFVPDVAEIENIFMLEEVIRAVAAHFGKNEQTAFRSVRRSLFKLFKADLRQQALQHTRQRVKKIVEHRIDGRFANIDKLEEHINDLAQAINPRGLYEQLCREFEGYLNAGNYHAILRVYNRKSMLTETHVGRACGLRGADKKDYIRAMLTILKENNREAERIRRAIFKCFGFDGESDVTLK